MRNDTAHRLQYTGLIVTSEAILLQRENRRTLLRVSSIV